jgi:hypothetical protein
VSSLKSRAAKTAEMKFAVGLVARTIMQLLSKAKVIGLWQNFGVGVTNQ